METTGNFSMRDLILGIAEVVNETKGQLPIGCVSYNEKSGYYNARDIADVANLNDNVVALNGFINDGLMVKFRSQRKAEKSDKFHGFMVVLELNGTYNGIVRVFTKTENEYKIYLHPDNWKIVSKTIEYKSDDEEMPDITREYKEPLILDRVSGEYKCLDRSTSVENKVLMAIKGKFRDDYDAYYEGAKFDVKECKFIKE